MEVPKYRNPGVGCIGLFLVRDLKGIIGMGGWGMALLGCEPVSL